jgi:hypothetical protein
MQMCKRPDAAAEPVTPDTALRMTREGYKNRTAAAI